MTDDKMKQVHQRLVKRAESKLECAKGHAAKFAKAQDGYGKALKAEFDLVVEAYREELQYLLAMPGILEALEEMVRHHTPGWWVDTDDDFLYKELNQARAALAKAKELS